MSSHVPTCLVCPTPTDSGPSIGAKLRPLCVEHWDGWLASGELDRCDRQGSKTPARAFQDWLTRVRAELKNHNPEKV